MITLLLAMSTFEPSWLSLVSCEGLGDPQLVRALVALDAPREVTQPVTVTCLENQRARIRFQDAEREIDLSQVSAAMQPQMLSLMIVDTVRARLALPLEGSATQPVIPTAIEQLNYRRDPRYARLTGGLTIGFVGASLLLMGIGVGITMLASQSNDVNLRTTGLAIAIASPFLFAAGGLTFAFWLHDRLHYAQRDVGAGMRLAFAW